MKIKLDRESLANAGQRLKRSLQIVTAGAVLGLMAGAQQPTLAGDL